MAPVAIVSHEHDAKLRGVGLADDDEASLLVATNDLAVVWTGIAFEIAAAVFRRHASEAHTGILEQQRDAAKRRFGTWLVGRRACLVGEDSNHRVETRIEVLDRRKRNLDELGGGDIATPYQLGEPDGIIGAVFGATDHQSASNMRVTALLPGR
jgi:hypothetical protein